MVNSRIRLRISSSISVISERLMSGSTSCSRVLMRSTLSECCLPACRQAIESKDHGMAVFSMMSLITASVVSPWLAACGPSHKRWART